MASHAHVSLRDFWSETADLIDPQQQDSGLQAPADWESWLDTMFPRAVVAGFGDHHREYWDWLWAIDSARPRPFIGIWARGGGKSTGGELGVAALGARGIRRYAVYVSETQGQADKRVSNVSSLLESESIAAYYPAMGMPATGKWGHPKGWRRNRLYTASGFVVDALGFDTAARGLKVEDQRPDLILLDDIDALHESKAAIARKVEILTQTILPMGASNLAVVGLQNLITNKGIFAQLANGEAGYLIDRIVSGPVPAIRDLKTVREARPGGLIGHRIVSGTPTWQGQSIEVCQGLIDTSALPSFLREQQHEVDSVEGALWMLRSSGDPEKDRGKALILRAAMPASFRRIVIGVDPSGGKAEIGIVAVGLGHDGKCYVIADESQLGRLGAGNWGSKAVGLYERLRADLIAAEPNYGGDMVEQNIRVCAGFVRLPVEMVHSSRGKLLRASPVASAYDREEIFHCGVFRELEEEMTTWIEGGPSPNRLDALVFAVTELLLTDRVQHVSGGSARPPGM